jgi:type I restriction enzyme M protein
MSRPTTEACAPKKEAERRDEEDPDGLDQDKADEAVKKPNGGEAVTHRTPQEIMDEIAALDAESAAVLKTIRGLL